MLNHLAIDSQGRIVFDSSDDAGDAFSEGQVAGRKHNGIEEEEEIEPDSMADTTVKEAEKDEEDVEMTLVRSELSSSPTSSGWRNKTFVPP